MLSNLEYLFKFNSSYSLTIFRLVAWYAVLSTLQYLYKTLKDKIMPELWNIDIKNNRYLVSSFITTDVRCKLTWKLYWMIYLSLYRLFRKCFSVTFHIRKIIRWIYFCSSFLYFYRHTCLQRTIQYICHKLESIKDW